MTDKEKEKNLEFQVVENATILSCQRKNGKFCSGIFDSEEKIVNQSLLFRTNIHGKNGQVVFPGDFILPENKLNGTYLFAGYLTGHYGHFLLESLARLWYIKKHPEIPIIWIHFTGPKHLKGWQTEIFSLLNIINQQIILDKSTKVDKIIIPDPGFILQDYLAEEQAQALIALKAEESIKGRKVWLSRSQLEPLGSLSLIYNEKDLETILETQGWLIFHPQKYTITKQLEMLASAEQIAGFEGSAFHTLVFLDDLKAKITIFGRRNVAQDIAVHKTYVKIAKNKQLKQTEHSVPTTKIRERTQNYGASVFLIHSYREIIDILNSNED